MAASMAHGPSGSAACSRASALSKRLRPASPGSWHCRAACSAPWCDTIQLNLTQAMALHPGAPPQLPHRDQDMWRGAIGEIEYLVNVMWPFTRYTRENGATRRLAQEPRQARARSAPARRRVSGGARARIGAAVPWLDPPRRRRQRQRRGPARSDRQLLPGMAQALREPVARLPAGDRAQLQPGTRRPRRLPAAPAQPRQL